MRLPFTRKKKYHCIRCWSGYGRKQHCLICNAPVYTVEEIIKAAVIKLMEVEDELKATRNHYIT